ncbi:hypothetical protein [Cellulomonas sp. KRMCY2]|uniref:hypothetical protein n=1 Tax=Cellulomonas sp. KRMCY2 TaxID=1304865 RepID=UPI00350EBAD2
MLVPLLAQGAASARRPAGRRTTGCSRAGPAAAAPRGSPGRPRDGRTGASRRCPRTWHWTPSSLARGRRAAARS